MYQYTIDPDRIPHQFAINGARKRSFILWREEIRDEKLTKVPYQISGAHARSNDPRTWSTLALVMEAYRGGGFDGIGFVFHRRGEPDAVFIDFDDCTDAAGVIEPWAQYWIDRFQSFTERSHSGEGLHTFCIGSVPANIGAGKKRKGLGPEGKGSVEIYVDGRYCALTTDTLPGLDRIAPTAETANALTEFCAEYWPEGTNVPELEETRQIEGTRQATLCGVEDVGEVSDSDLFSAMLRSIHGSSISALWNGDLSAHGGDDSAADLALCNRLAWWCDYDTARVDRLFRQSRLMRPKWDAARSDTTYGAMTIAKAVAGKRPGDGWKGTFGSYDPSVENDAPRLVDADAEPDDSAPAPPRTVGQSLTQCPVPQLRLPAGWWISPQGTGRVEHDRDGKAKRVQIGPAPLLLTGRAEDLSADAAYLVLAWQRPGSPWRYLLTERGTALSARRLPDLLRHSLPIFDSEAKSVARYLTELEAANLQSLACARLTSRLGWQGSPEEKVPFLLGQTLIGTDGTFGETTTLDASQAHTWTADTVAWHAPSGGEGTLARAFRTKGTWNGWLAAIGQLQPHPVAMAFLHLGFVPPLLEILGCPNFLAELAHSTTMGKTTVLRAVASIYGNPDERLPDTLLTTWNQTLVYAERASAVCNHLPLILDDSKNRKSNEIAEQIVYSVTSGHGRGRGTLSGLAETDSWRNVLFSTGEEPITSVTQSGGSRTRCLIFRTPTLGEKSTEMGELAKHLNSELCKHFGHAGRRFIAFLMRNRARWAEWRADYEHAAAVYAQRTSSPEAGRLAQYVAAGTVAGRLAHEALSLPWENTEPLNLVWPDLAAEARDAAGAERALEAILSWAQSSAHRFHGRGFEPLYPKTECAGRWDPNGDLCVYPTLLREQLVRAGFHSEAILTEWRQRGWLQCGEGNFTAPIRIGKSKDRMIVLNAEAISSHTEYCEEFSPS